MIRAVVDTSIVVRAVLKPQSTVGPVLDLLEENRYKLLYSEATLEELVDVLAKPRLLRRFPLRGRDSQTVVELIVLRGEAVKPRRRWTVCRDPKDDKFLDVAVEGLRQPAGVDQRTRAGDGGHRDQGAIEAVDCRTRYSARLRVGRGATPSPKPGARHYGDRCSRPDDRR